MSTERDTAAPRPRDTVRPFDAFYRDAWQTCYRDRLNTLAGRPSRRAGDAS